MLFEDFVPIFLLVFHPLEYHHGYDGNRFLDKRCLPNGTFGLTQKYFDFIIEGTISIIV
jgi:hypothetical protein